ncbi:MAG TPA: hypothetical protein VHU13_08575 [Solirubrobacteraceae bacterium]|nr:hypothetical protein [Solirubrobacteraceae bacterium]
MNDRQLVLGWALVAAALPALIAVGCGQSRSAQRSLPLVSAAHASAATALVRRAAALTLAASAGVELQLNGASAFGPSHAPVLGSGEFDFPSASGSESVDLGETGGQEPGNERVLFLSQRVYLQPKATGTSVLPRGREWVSAQLTGSESVSTNFPAFALQAQSIDPQLPLSELAGGAVAATPIAGASIGGLPARGFAVTVDLGQALDRLTGASAGALGQAIQTELAPPTGAGSPRIAIDAWVGLEGRIARLRIATPDSGTGTATMTLCCYGAPVAVSAPASARVIDVSSLTPSGERENNGGGDSDGG